MKPLLILSLIIFSSSALAGEGLRKSLLESYFVVVSSKKMPGTPTGKCAIHGHVYDPHKSEGENGLNNVIVSNLSRTCQTTTDSTGAYKFLLNANDTSIFAFKSQREELVIWNYPFQEGFAYEINFYLTENFELLEVDKPVIYLYSEEEKDVTISFDFKGDLTFTYPAYDNQWQANVSANGIQVEGKPYPYLFWEGETSTIAYDQNEEGYLGTFIKTDTLISFLEHSLAQLGLNNTEQTDFITFWLPKLNQKDYAFISFKVDEAYENQIAQIHVDPQPESMRRVYMLFTSYDVELENKHISSQKLPSFERKGFTLIEWGGSEVKQNYIYNYDTANH